MIEDDILAIDGWYHRTIAGLKQAAYQSRSYMYLRLFNTEEFLGWNAEHLFSHVAWSLCAIAFATLVLKRLRKLSPTARDMLTPLAMALICLVFMPLIIVLYFAAGKITVMPLATGINVMNRYGCCSQGVVFPQNQAKKLVERNEKKRLGFIDTRMEEYCDAFDETRFALTPSVLQHIGIKSSKTDEVEVESKYNRPVAAKLWSFAFERYDSSRLHNEHLQSSIKSDA